MGMLATLRHLFHPQRSNNHRPRLLHPDAFLVYATLSVFFVVGMLSLTRLSQKVGDVLGFSSTITPAEVIVQTNLQREKLGLPPLISNKALNEAALAKAQDMMSKQYWAHTAPDGTQPWTFFKQFKYEYSVAGENLARDFGNTSDMVNAWMDSPTHRANIIHNKYTEIGIAVVDGKLNGIETTLVVQFFGTPAQQAAQLPDRAARNATEVQLPTAADVVPVISFAEQQVESLKQAVPQAQAEVLSSVSYRISQFTPPPLFSPLQLTKAFFLAVLLIVIATLIYDMLIMHHRQQLRMVGKNLAHIVFFLVIAFLVVYFKSGVIA